MVSWIANQSDYLVCFGFFLRVVFGSGDKQDDLDFAAFNALFRSSHHLQVVGTSLVQPFVRGQRVKL